MKQLLLMSIYFLIITCKPSFGQTWTVLYDEVSTPTFFNHTYDNETVLEKFDPDNGTMYSRGELVMFRSIDDPSGNNFLMVSLIDNNGQEYFGASAIYPASNMLDPFGDRNRLVPIAAAYNDGRVNGRPTYIVCGYGSVSSSNSIQLWYMTFNQNLQLINAESFPITAGNFPQLGFDCDVFVTDVTASYGNQQPDMIDFAFTGKISPIAQANNAFHAARTAGARTFICEINTNNPGTIEGFFCPSLNVVTTNPSLTYDNDKETFPSSIDEITTFHNNGINDGYVIGGTIISRDHDRDNYPYFIIRTGYNTYQPGLSNNPIQIGNGFPYNTFNNNNYSCYANQLLNAYNSLKSSKLNLQEVVYDHNVESIVMAGSFLHNDINSTIKLEGFFVDQIQVVSSNNSIPTSLTTTPGLGVYYHYPNSFNWVSGSPNPRGVGILFNPNDDWATNYHIKYPIIDGIFYDQNSTGSTFHIGAKIFGEVYTRPPGGLVGNLPLAFEVDYNFVTNSGDWSTFNSANIGLFPRDMNLNRNKDITPGTHSLQEKQYKRTLSKHHQSRFKYENGKMFYFLGGLGNYPYYNNAYDQTVLNKVFYDNNANNFISNCLTHDNMLGTENYSTKSYPINDNPWLNSGIAATSIPSTMWFYNQPNDMPFRVEECGNPTYFKMPTTGISNTETSGVLVWQNEHNIHWKGDYSNIKSMKVYNITGAKVADIPAKNFPLYSYTLNNLTSGMYLLKVDYYDSEYQILKLLY